MEEKYVTNKKHFADLNDMRLAGQLCDVTIKVNSREFQAHKIVLASNLNYFRLMFLNDSFLETKQNVVTMKNLEEEYLEEIINYAYTGELLVTYSNVLRLLEIGNYFGEDFIKDECIDFLAEHLKKSDACRVYQFANAIDCLPLKATARSRILSNIEYCSQTAEYLDFDCDSLETIFCDIHSHPESQQSFFEGLIHWILHDVENRKIHVQDLVNLIDMSKLAPDYIIKYFCSTTKDYSDIATEIMIIYNGKIQKPTNQEEIRLNDSLMVVGLTDENTLKMQFYDSTGQKWCQPREIIHLNQLTFDQCTIFRNQLIYTVYDFDAQSTTVTHLRVFDLSTKQNTMTTSENRLLRYSAMCASTDMIYLCGGRTVDGESASNQVLKYDPRTNHFEKLRPMRIKRACSVAIVYQGYILVLGGIDKAQYHLDSVEKYDPSINRWMAFPSMSYLRGLFKVALLNEKLYAVGHCGVRGDLRCEVYDPSTNRWREINIISGIRRGIIIRLYIIAHKGKLLCIETERGELARVYDPSDNRCLVDEKMSTGLRLRIAGVGLVPSIYGN